MCLLPAWTCLKFVDNPLRGQKRALSLETGIRQLWESLCVLGIKSGSSARATTAFNADASLQPQNFLGKREQFVQKTTTGQWAERDACAFSPKQEIVVIPSPQALESYMEGGQKEHKNQNWWMTSKYLCFPDTTGMHIQLTEIVVACTWASQTQVRQSPSMEEGSGAWRHIPSWGAICIWLLLGAGESLFVNGVTPGTLTTFQGQVLWWGAHQRRLLRLEFKPIESVY